MPSAVSRRGATTHPKFRTNSLGAALSPPSLPPPRPSFPRRQISFRSARRPLGGAACSGSRGAGGARPARVRTLTHHHALCSRSPKSQEPPGLRENEWRRECSVRALFVFERILNSEQGLVSALAILAASNS